MLETLIFSNQRKYVLTRHGLFWLSWLLFFTYIYAQKFVSIGPEVAYVSSFWEALIYMPIHIGMGYALIYWIIPHYLLRSRYLMAVLLMVVSILLAALVSHFFTAWFVEPLRVSMGLPNPMSNMFYGLMAGLRGTNTTTGFTGTIKLLKFWYQKKIENETLKREKLNAELTMLKGQLHPHFLFNTLNNLYGHIVSGSGQSGDIVLKLSGLLRYMLYECSGTQVPLSKEVLMLESYVELEKLRYGQRLDVSFTVTGVQDTHRVAPLVLLPFVENAFKHGTSQLLDQAWISISASVTGNELAFKVINPVWTESTRPADSGIGLANVQKRLELLYPNRFTLKITEGEDTFVVFLKIALDEAAEVPADERKPDSYEFA
ncbi:sensor histidine kinase [Telluribacter sp.]|jgi:sensor histidine kinase YesM|uniref:sensor histidine kinase n=1 Tax=Telluribacter sp. TaxID=1978767 RepID=UPI002E148D13|nr:histidine kinase [Telluribacter sp.]